MKSHTNHISLATACFLGAFRRLVDFAVPAMALLHYSPMLLPPAPQLLGTLIFGKVPLFGEYMRWQYREYAEVNQSLTRTVQSGMDLL